MITGIRLLVIAAGGVTGTALLNELGAIDLSSINIEELKPYIKEAASNIKEAYAFFSEEINGLLEEVSNNKAN